MLGYLVKYPPGLSNVAMENRLKRRFVAGNFIELNGGFSSKACLISGG